MTVELFVQLLVNGLVIAGMYALVASGFTLTLGVLKVFNFAQGQFYMLGAFITYAVFAKFGLPYWAAIIISLVSMAIFGALIHLAIIRWTMPWGFFHMTLATVALSTIITQSSLIAFGGHQKVVPPVFRGSWLVNGVAINKSSIVVIFGAVAVMVALFYFMKTKTGTAMLAAAENKDVAGLQGINAHSIFWITMAVGAGLCGVAGALIAPILTPSTTMGSLIFSKSMLVVMVGGTGSMAGALIAAFIVGIVESFTFQYIGQLNLLVMFALIAVLIFFRPGGLLGKPLPIQGL
jgi:branched-chain amino acid transport system permease protein